MLWWKSACPPTAQWAALIFELALQVHTHGLLHFIQPADDGGVQNTCQHLLCDFQAMISRLISKTTKGTKNSSVKFTDLHAGVKGSVDLCPDIHHLTHTEERWKGGVTTFSPTLPYTLTHASSHLMVCSKWMSSIEAVTQGLPACLSAARSNSEVITTCTTRFQHTPVTHKAHQRGRRRSPSI